MLRFFRFRLRTLLIVVAILALPMAWIAEMYRKLRTENRVAYAIQNLHGYPNFDEEAGATPSPRLFPRLKTVAFYATSTVGDADLAMLRDVPELEELFLADVNITDEGLSHLRELTALRALQLSGIPVTDAGLQHLHGLTHLRWLKIEETLVSPAGVEELQRALPDCRIDYQDGREIHTR